MKSKNSRMTLEKLTVIELKKHEVVFGGLRGFPMPLLQIIHIFGLYWTVNIIVNIGMFTLSGAFSQWYWTQRDDFKDLATNPLGLSKLILVHFRLYSEKV